MNLWDPANNSVTITALKPDVTIKEFEVQNAGNTRLLRVRVANNGSLKAKNVNLAIYCDSLDGECLFTTLISEIMPGKYKDVTYTWYKPFSSDRNKIETFAVLDESNIIDEFDESNNTDSIEVDSIKCPGDFDNDGDVDGSDLAVFAADFGRTDCSIGPECKGDFDHDNDVDGSDLAVFAADFGRTDCSE